MHILSPFDFTSTKDSSWISWSTSYTGNKYHHWCWFWWVNIHLNKYYSFKWISNQNKYFYCWFVSFFCTLFLYSKEQLSNSLKFSDIFYRWKYVKLKIYLLKLACDVEKIFSSYSTLIRRDNFQKFYTKIIRIGLENWALTNCK